MTDGPNLSWTSAGAWTNSSRVTFADVLKLVGSLGPAPDRPIRAFRGTVGDLRAAVDAENARLGLGLDVGSCDTFWGLDVVEEDGWMYIGTARKIREARVLWGSLTLARRAAEMLDASAARREAAEASRRVREDLDLSP